MLTLDLSGRSRARLLSHVGKLGYSLFIDSEDEDDPILLTNYIPEDFDFSEGALSSFLLKFARDEIAACESHGDKILSIYKWTCLGVLTEDAFIKETRSFWRQG